jgi:hypothetical protein
VSVSCLCLCLCLCLCVCASYRNIVQLHSKLGISTPHYPPNSQLPTHHLRRLRYTYNHPYWYPREKNISFPMTSPTCMRPPQQSPPSPNGVPAHRLALLATGTYWFTFWLLLPYTNNEPRSHSHLGNDTNISAGRRSQIGYSSIIFSRPSAYPRVSARQSNRSNTIYSDATSYCKVPTS